MLIKLVEVNLNQQQSSVRELYVNTASIISITAESRPRVLEEVKSLGFSKLFSSCF